MHAFAEFDISSWVSVVKQHSPVLPLPSSSRCESNELRAAAVQRALRTSNSESTLNPKPSRRSCKTLPVLLLEDLICNLVAVFFTLLLPQFLFLSYSHDSSQWPGSGWQREVAALPQRVDAGGGLAHHEIH